MYLFASVVISDASFCPVLLRRYKWSFPLRLPRFMSPLPPTEPPDKTQAPSLEMPMFSRKTSSRRSSMAPQPSGCYSHAIREGNHVHICGWMGVNPQTAQIVPGGIQAQTVSSPLLPLPSPTHPFAGLAQLLAYPLTAPSPCARPTRTRARTCVRLVNTAKIRRRETGILG